MVYMDRSKYRYYTHIKFIGTFYTLSYHHDHNHIMIKILINIKINLPRIVSYLDT